MTNTITLRREWRTLSKAERTLFLNTVLKLMKRDDNNSPSFFDRQAKLFGDNSRAVPEQNIRKGGLINTSPLLHFSLGGGIFCFFLRSNCKRLSQA
jgi:hypothetical protein